MTFPVTIPLKRLSLLLSLLLCLPASGAASQLRPAAIDTIDAVAAPRALPLAFPPDLGEIVYRQNGESSVQIFIIVNSHRSSGTGGNGPGTVQAQVETFRIGEWLIGQEQIALLLPEGFFGREATAPPVPGVPVCLNGEELAAELTDTSAFVNAELLLHRNYGIGLQQIEDLTLYRQTRDRLRTGLTGTARLEPGFAAGLDYLQKRRLAAILQNIPEAIEGEYRLGRIVRPKAMLTIGMAHLPDLIDYLETGRIQLPVPATEDQGFESLNAELELVRQAMGVTIIVPRALCDGRTPLQTARVEPEVNPVR
jgi:hypothetical protein